MNHNQSVQKLICINPFNQDHIDKLMEFETHLSKEEQPLALSKIYNRELKGITSEQYQEKRKLEEVWYDNFFLEEANQFKASCYVEEKEKSVEVYIFVPTSYRRNHYATNLLKMIEQYVFFHHPTMKGITANVNLDNHQALGLFSNLNYQLASTNELSSLFYQANKKYVPQDKDAKIR